MFLVVLAVTFLAAKTITKHDFESFNDMEEILVESEDFLDVTQHSKDIFIIDDTENSNCLPESANSPILSVLERKTKVKKSSNISSTVFRNWRSLLGQNF